MALRQITSNMTAGVINPTLEGRIDLKQYYNALRTAKNVTIMPHGGLTRRGGLKNIATVINIGRLFAFEYSVSEAYLLHFDLTSLRIYKDDVLVHTHTLSTALTQTQLDEMDIIQTANTIIITHEDLPPFRIVRTSDTVWNQSNLPLTKIPIYDFATGFVGFRDYYVGDGTKTEYFLIATSKPFVVKINGVIKLDTTDYTYDEATNSITFLIAPLLNDDIQITSGEGTIQDNSYPFEDVWSVTKKYPKTCTFHKNRLCFGGSKSLINTVWCSVVNDYFNFDISSARADDGIFDTLEADQYNNIINIVSGSKLQVFTSGGEWVNKADILTPQTSSWARTGGYGGSRIKPVYLDGATYYLDRNKKNLRQFVYDFNQDNEISTNISMLADHLLNDVVDMDVQRGTTTDIGNLVFIVNGDGTIAVLNTMRDQEIRGFTSWNTYGTFKKVSVVNNDIYFVVTRDEGSYIEKIDKDLLLDHSFVDTNTDTLAVDLELQNATAIKIVGDNIVQQNDTATGTNAIADDVVSVLYAGYDLDVEIETLPLALATQYDSNIVHRKKRISRVFLQVHETRGVYINGEYMVDLQFMYDVNKPPTNRTGIVNKFCLGYSRIQTVKITQNNPDPLTILNIDVEVV